MKKFKVDKELFPFGNKFLELSDGSKVHYIDEGQGPVLLMFHGNPTWSFLYRKMIQHLKNDFRCIAFDYPGFGLSEAPKGYDFSAKTHSLVAEEFINKLKIEDVIIIGQDWGGPIGLGWAGRNPKKIKGAILGNTWAWPLAGNPRFEVFSWLMGGPIGRWMAVSFNGVWKFFMLRGFIKKRSKREMAMYKAPFKEKANRIQTVIFPRQLVKAKTFEAEVEKGLQNFNEIPVLLCWGTEDFAFKEPERKRFQNVFKNHETVMLNSSHFWQDEAGEKASHTILKWHQKTFINRNHEIF